MLKRFSHVKAQNHIVPTYATCSEIEFYEFFGWFLLRLSSSWKLKNVNRLCCSDWDTTTQSAQENPPNLFFIHVKHPSPKTERCREKSEVSRLRICFWKGLKRQLIWHERISNYHLFINPFFFVNIRYDVILSRLDRANSMKVLKHLANVDFRCEAASWLTSVLQNESSAEFALQLHRYKRI